MVCYQHIQLELWSCLIRLQALTQTPQHVGSLYVQRKQQNNTSDCHSLPLAAMNISAAHTEAFYTA